MKLEELVRLCKSYSDLGWAIQGQIDNVLENTMSEDRNDPNALRFIREWLQDVSDVPDLREEADDMIERIYEYEESL